MHSHFYDNDIHRSPGPPICLPAPAVPGGPRRRRGSRRRSTRSRGRTARSSPTSSRPGNAANRAHGFRTYFTEDGIRVVPRTEETPSWGVGAVARRARSRREGDGAGAEATIRPEGTGSATRGARSWSGTRTPARIGAGVHDRGRGPRSRGPSDRPPMRPPRAVRRDRRSRPTGERIVIVQLELTGTTPSPPFSTDGQAIHFRDSAAW